MDEAKVKSEIMQQLKRRVPSACAIRHEDLFRSGVPDISVTMGLTHWLEVKYVRPKDTDSKIREHFPKLQLATCLWLERQGRCNYLVAFAHGRMTYAVVIKPVEVVRMLAEPELSIDRLSGFARASASLKDVVDRFIVNMKEEDPRR